MLDAAQKPELVVQTGHSQVVETVAFSQDGKLLASGSGDGAIKLWDVKSGVMLRTLLGYADTVYSIAFSPDGTKLATLRSRFGIFKAERNYEVLQDIPFLFGRSPLARMERL
jgi:WD40 repeat protein